ncbi:MAG: cadherin-like domain-containing protein [Nitrospirae bacterium]|nr:cadherin-like domain-containing protein [Nitrospirota bacterium]
MSGTTYNVAVTGMTGTGTVVASVGAGAASDAAGNPSAASTSTDNTVTFTGINARPTANPDGPFTVAEGGTFTLPSTVGARGLLQNDVDPDGTLAGLTAHTLVAGGLPTNGTLTLNADGSFTYVHNGSETTSDSFQYRAFDGVDFSDPTTVTISITPQNDAPTITSSAVTTATVGAMYTYDVAATDPDHAAATLVFSLQTFPTGMTIDPSTGLITWVPGSATVLTVKTESGHLMRYPQKYFSHIGLRINDRLPGLVRARPLRGPSQASAHVRPCAATGSAV